MKRRPDWWSGVRSVTLFSGDIDGGVRSTHSPSSSRSHAASSSRHTERMGRKRRKNWDFQGCYGAMLMLIRIRRDRSAS